MSLRCEPSGVKTQDTEDVTRLRLSKAVVTGSTCLIMGVRIVKRFILELILDIY